MPTTCLYCKTEQTVRYYQDGSPILACGHGIFPEGSEERRVEDCCADAEQTAQRVMRERHVSRDEADAIVLKESLYGMSRSEMISLLRSLAKLSVWCSELSDLIETFDLPRADIFGGNQSDQHDAGL